jgi:Ni,Fe-hydrogenase maturation factor
VGGSAAAASSHHMTPEVLLGLAAELYGAAPETWVLSIGAANLELGDDLSVEVTTALDGACAKVIELLDA